MENIATNKRNLMNPDELLKLDNNKEIVIVRGRKPFICNKYVIYSSFFLNIPINKCPFLLLLGGDHLSNSR